MGTRSTIHIYEGRKHVLSVYNQWDGYLSGVGGELYEFLSKGQIVNGFSIGDEINFNGVWCLAAQLVAKFKTGIGGCYITDFKDRQEYNYFVIVNSETGKISIKVTDWENKQILKGGLDDLFNACKNDGYEPKTMLDKKLLKGA